MKMRILKLVSRGRYLKPFLAKRFNGNSSTTDYQHFVDVLLRNSHEEVLPLNYMIGTILKHLNNESFPEKKFTKLIDMEVAKLLRNIVN